ncbi:hypothetical protein O181_063844 [Austropuccinia psidii MF-1]|uniref:Uncharacterized protein n=1 Tax=Austropuccinia psidii MF-1 TaxID=1389203 RepID=A0A9Q3EMX6_9BASI|nr:hypothetical protein [Austropuccinia psidii MF-1]
MDLTPEVDIRYHERQKETNNFQEKNTEASKSSSSHPKNYTSSIQKKKNSRVQKREKPHPSLLDRDHKLMGSEKERGFKEGLCAYYGGNNSIEACFTRPQNQLTQTEGRFPSQGKALVNIMLCSTVFSIFHPGNNFEF